MLSALIVHVAWSLPYMVKAAMEDCEGKPIVFIARPDGEQEEGQGEGSEEGQRSVQGAWLAKGEGQQTLGLAGQAPTQQVQCLRDACGGGSLLCMWTVTFGEIHYLRI